MMKRLLLTMAGDPDSTSFTAYRDCMIEQGYTLRTY